MRDSARPEEGNHSSLCVRGKGTLERGNDAEWVLPSPLAPYKSERVHSFPQSAFHLFINTTIALRHSNACTLTHPSQLQSFLPHHARLVHHPLTLSRSASHTLSRSASHTLLLILSLSLAHPLTVSRSYARPSSLCIQANSDGCNTKDGLSSTVRGRTPLHSLRLRSKDCLAQIPLIFFQ